MCDLMHASDHCQRNLASLLVDAAQRQPNETADMASSLSKNYVCKVCSAKRSHLPVPECIREQPPRSLSDESLHPRIHGHRTLTAPGGLHCAPVPLVCQRSPCSEGPCKTPANPTMCLACILVMVLPLQGFVVPSEERKRRLKRLPGTRRVNWKKSGQDC